jgi:hypothetical protein
MKYSWIATLISIVALSSLLFSCTKKELFNEYVFSNTNPDWCVIVNGCEGGDDFIERDRRKFVFPESGVLLANIDDFEVTENDIFLIGQTPFDPNSTAPESYKLCYYTASLNGGYNSEYYSKKFDIPSLGKDVNTFQVFDLYFFRIGKSCDKEVETGNELFQIIYLYLLKNKVISARTN